MSFSCWHAPQLTGRTDFKAAFQRQTDADLQTHVIDVLAQYGCQTGDQRADYLLAPPPAQNVGMLTRGNVVYPQLKY